MELTRTKIDFKDRRGVISDILDDVPVNAITYITSKKGVVRGNHYHKRTTQWAYLLSGRMRYVSRRGAGPARSVLMRPGDLVMSPPGEVHTMVALADSAFLAISKGPRHGKNYEADTFRPAEPLVR